MECDDLLGPYNPTVPPEDQSKHQGSTAGTGEAEGGMPSWVIISLIAVSKTIRISWNVSCGETRKTTNAHDLCMYCEGYLFLYFFGVFTLSTAVAQTDECPELYAMNVERLQEF